MRHYGTISLLVLTLVTFAFPVTSSATIYKWEDAQGNTHFTDDLTRVPPSQREDVEIENLPTGPANVAPAAAVSPAAAAPAQDDSEPRNDYEECQKRVTEEKEKWTNQLEEDEDRLVELNRLIHRATASRKKNAYQRERVAIKERIAKCQELLRDTIPPMEHECETIRYWQGEE
jgi:hypothetical protein